MKPCRACNHTISEKAVACPRCGAPFPAKETWDGYGFEYKTRTKLFGLPLLHISFKYRANRMPVPAKGVIAIGQFAMGIFALAQFSIALFSVSQFTIAGLAIAQFAAAYSLIAQIGVYFHVGYGQKVWRVMDLIGNLLV